MELFLLFSLALTLVAFLSIVLAEPPSPLTLATESEFQLEIIVPNTTVQHEQVSQQTGKVLLDDEEEPAAAKVVVERLPAMA